MKNHFNLVVVALLLVVSSAFAQESADSIAQKVYDREDGKDSWADAEMVLIDKSGTRRERKLTVASKDFGEVSKRYIRFTEPSAIAGTAFLSIEQHDGGDEQFLYLPSVQRVRRIASGQKDRLFVNTDFTYEDLERRKVERDSYRLIGTEKVLNKDTWILERVAKDKDDSQYEKVVLWVAKDSYLVLKSHMYKAGKVFRTFEATKVEQVDDIWTVMESLAHSLDKNHKTLSKTHKIRYNKGVPDNIFTAHYMEKGN